MPRRYLDAAEVKLETAAPQFVAPGHCLWCNKPLTGKAKLYCSLKEDPDRDTWVWTISRCSMAFKHYFYDRPAFVRATFIRDDFTCRQCGVRPMREDRPWLPELSKLECDHILPLAKGGFTEMTNLQTLCRECNRKKATSMPPGVVEKEPARPRIKRSNSKCPYCRQTGYRVLPWEPPECYDPQMLKVRCSTCGCISYLAPAVRLPLP